MNFTKTLDANEMDLDESLQQVTSGSGQQLTNYQQDLTGKKGKNGNFLIFLIGYAGSPSAQVHLRSVCKAEVRSGTLCA